MTIAKMLELAQTLPYEQNCFSKINLVGLVSSVMEPIDTSLWTIDNHRIEERLKFKLLYSQTTDNFKYGDQLWLVHLDNEPVVVIDTGGKWMATLITYTFDPDRLARLRGFFQHISNTKHDIGPTPLTNEMLSSIAPWYNGKLTDPDGYPFRDDK